MYQTHDLHDFFLPSVLGSGFSFASLPDVPQHFTTQDNERDQGSHRLRIDHDNQHTGHLPSSTSFHLTFP